MPRGLFITLEGLDGSGKTTQIKRLATWMQRRGLEPLVTRQPGGTATGDRIRALLLDSASGPLAPMTEMALMFADRAQAIAYVERAMQMPGDDERVLGFCGAALACSGGDLGLAARLTDRGIAINPGSATILFWGGWLDVVCGRPERGLERLETSIRLNPLSEIRPLLLIPLGTCLLLLRRFDEAAVILGESVQAAPQGGGLAPLAVALAHAGRLDQAADAHRRLIESGGSWAGLGLLQDPAHVALVRAGINIAGAAASGSRKLRLAKG